MKKVVKLLKYFIPALIILTIAFVFLYEPALSEDQKSTVELLGYPSQFVITYLPRGDADNPQLVRNEVWYYPESSTKITFLGGQLVDEEEYINDGEFEKTPLKPQDFDFFLTYEDLEDIFGIENIVPIDFLPVLYEENETATYLTDLALFIIESDQLTYFQTLGSSDEGFYLDEENGDQIEEEKTQDVSVESKDESSFKTYQNYDLNIRVDYPSEWYLDDDNTVLSTYDTGYLEKGLDLPEKRLKCDFFDYDNSDIEIEDEDQIIDEDVSVYEGMAVEKVEVAGPGLGDSHLFLFRKTGVDTIGLLCYAYDDSFYLRLLEMLKTFEYIE